MENRLYRHLYSQVQNIDVSDWAVYPLKLWTFMKKKGKNQFEHPTHIILEVIRLLYVIYDDGSPIPVLSKVIVWFHEM